MSKQLTIEDLRAKIKVLSAKKERLEAQVTEVSRQIDGLETTIELFSESPKRSKRTNTRSYENPSASLLTGMSLNEALPLIAESNGGEIYSTYARVLLQEAGILVGEHAGNTLWEFLSESPDFSRVGRGRYKWETSLGDSVDDDSG